MRTIHIPKKLKLGTMTYSIVSLDDEENYSFRGYHSWEKGKIGLTDELERPQLEIAYLHEVIHAMDAVYMGKSLREKQVKRLSFALHDFLLRNKIFDR